MTDFAQVTIPPLADGLLGWCAETTLVAAVLAALAALGSGLRRVAPGPAARHALWLMVLIKLLLPPMVACPWSIPAPVPIAAARAAPRVVRDFALVSSPSPARPLALAATAGKSAGPVGRAPIGPGGWVVLAWLGGSLVVAGRQARQIWRFRRLLLGATPAPGWLVEEVAALGRRLAARVPPVLVVPGLGSPVLWCLGRPKLLVPAKLLATLEAGRWRPIVAHELAHLRRGDHWVRRLELVAGLAWWWNPLYWLARNRLDFEAELACDAWAVWARPADRIPYAESLIRICTTLSAPESPAPALGVVGTGRSFERRLTMILHNPGERRVSTPGLLAAFLLAILAIPSWTLAGPASADDAPAKPTAAPAVRHNRVAPMVLDDDDDTDDAEEEGDDDDDADHPGRKAAKKGMKEVDGKLNDLDRQMKEKFGPGSEFARKMEAFGKEMVDNFGPGSDFARELAKNFGPDSDFAAELKKELGPGSDFAKQMQRLGSSDDEAESGEDESKGKADKTRAESRKARGEAEKARSESRKAHARAEADRAKGEARKIKFKAEVSGGEASPAKAKPAADKRARRIEALESRLKELSAELKELKAESKSGDEDDDQG